MMTIKIRIIIAALLVLAFIYVVRSVVKKKIDVKYALPWLGMLIVLVIFDCIPGLLDSLTKLVGIASPVNMLFFMGFCFALMIIFYLTAMIYSVSCRLRKVSQELALLKKQIEEERHSNGEE